MDTAMPAVMLVDDHRLFSTSVALALRSKGFEVDAPPLTSLAELRDRISEARPDLVIVDRALGGIGDGEPLIACARAAGVPAVVVSGALDDVAAGRCYALGAAACLSKSEPLEVLLAIVAAVAGGEQPVPRGEQDRLVDVWRRWQAAADAAAGPFGQLTRRESEVLRGLMDGIPVRAIAAANVVSEVTVRSQVRGILAKLGVSSQLEAVAMAQRAGWSGPGQATDGEARGVASPRGD
ncbi:MAG: response regulator transcription factor [Acidimicrobiales bacterium]